jgi:hypothetical protein
MTVIWLSRTDKFTPLDIYPTKLHLMMSLIYVLYSQSRLCSLMKLDHVLIFVVPISEYAKMAQLHKQHLAVVKIGREKNIIAHTLAQHALKTRLSKASFAYVPQRIQ